MTFSRFVSARWPVRGENLTTLKSQMQAYLKLHLKKRLREAGVYT
jgi:hypothetical protein